MIFPRAYFIVAKCVDIYGPHFLQSIQTPTLFNSSSHFDLHHYFCAANFLGQNRAPSNLRINVIWIYLTKFLEVKTMLLGEVLFDLEIF